MNYIHITFLPGSAGNFLARSLSLSDSVYSFVKSDNFIKDDLAKKLEVLAYTKIFPGNWVGFENEIDLISSKYSVEEITERIGNNSSIVSFIHPEPDYYLDYLGPDDNLYNFLIVPDTKETINWMISNGLHKHSLPATATEFNDIVSGPELQGMVDEFIKLQHNPEYHQIKLSELISKDTFLETIKNVCYIAGIKYTPGVNTLFDQWIKTTVTEKDFDKTFFSMFDEILYK